jgi:hypothetical protein
MLSVLVDIGITSRNLFLGILDNGPPVPSDRFQCLQQGKTPLLGDCFYSNVSQELTCTVYPRKGSSPLSTIKDNKTYYELLPLSRNLSNGYVPSKSYGSPPVRSQAALPAIQADAVILDLQTTEWFLVGEARSFRQVFPLQSVERKIAFQESDFASRNALRAYQKQTFPLLSSQRTGRQIDRIA